MEYIVPIKWTTNIKDIDAGKFIALVKVEPTESEKKSGIKPYIDRTFLEYKPLTGWCYANADNTPLPSSSQVLAVADYQVWPSDEAVMKLCDTSSYENYGATRRDFEDYFSDTFCEAHEGKSLTQDEISNLVGDFTFPEYAPGSPEAERARKVREAFDKPIMEVRRRAVERHGEEAVKKFEEQMKKVLSV